LAYLELEMSGMQCRYCARGDFKLLSRREDLRPGSMMLLECQGCGRLRSEQAKIVQTPLHEET